MTRTFLLALTAPPNTDQDLVPSRPGCTSHAPAPRWGYDTKQEISR